MTNSLTDTYDPERLDFSERYYRAVACKLGTYFFTKTSPEIDKYEAADLMLLYSDRNIRVAVRLRKYDKYEKYKGDITIRSENNGYQTEATKILDGKGTHLFYGWGHPDGRNVVGWSLIDLRELRANWDTIPKVHQPNPDKKTAFLVIKLKDLDRFQPPIILACAPEIRHELEIEKQVKKPVARAHSIAADDDLSWGKF